MPVPARLLSALAFVSVCSAAALAATPRSPAAIAAVAPAAASVVADDVTADATSSNNQVKLVRDPSGVVWVVFVMEVDHVPQIVLAQSRDGGGHWAPVAQASSGPVASRLPAIGLDGAEGLHVVWTRYDDGVGKIYYRLWRQGRWTGPQTRISPPSRYAGFPGLAVDPAGRPHVVWYGIREGAVPAASRHSSVYEIFYTGFDGGAWLAPQLVSTGLPDSINPALAADRAGRLHAAWFQFDGRVYQVRYAIRSTGWAETETVLASRADAFNPDLAVGPGGRPTVAWELHEGQGSTIRTASRGERGWDDPVDLSDPAAQALHPSVAVGPRGTVYAGWETNDGRVFVRRFAGRWEPAVRPAGDGGNTFPSVAASEGGADLVWTHTDAGRSSLRYLRLGSAGTSPGRPAVFFSPALWAAALLFAALLIFARARLRLRRFHGF